MFMIKSTTFKTCVLLRGMSCLLAKFAFYFKCIEYEYVLYDKPAAAFHKSRKIRLKRFHSANKFISV